MKPASWLVHGGFERTPFAETSEGMFLTSGYVYNSAEEAESAFKGETERFIYSRYGNPTVEIFEKRITQLEGAEMGKATASGMAAVFAALLSCLKAGERIVASRALFGSCHYIVDEILPRYGIKREFVDGQDLNAWEKALSQPAACVFLESPSNPCLEVLDIKEISRLAHKAGALVVIDNVFATPLLQRPLELGADIVVYSATKHIDGQGRCLGGIVLGSRKFIEEGPFKQIYRHTGPSLSPFNAWVLLKGLETLPLRVERACRTALELASRLEAQGIEVIYPGLPSHPQHALVKAQMQAGGTLLAFTLKGGKDAAFRFMNALKLIKISNNLGDAKSLITHPATTTHQRLKPEDRAELGIGPGLVRLSVGLEDVDDLWEDIVQAL